MTEDEVFGWHHQLNGHEFEQAPELVMDREAWRAVVHGVTKSRTRLTELKNKTNKQKTDKKTSSVQSISRVRLFVIPWTASLQASLSITNSQSLLKLMSIEFVMPCNHLILCHLLLLPPSIFPSIRVFSDESVIFIRWPEYWNFSFSSSPSNKY